MRSRQDESELGTFIEIAGSRMVVRKLNFSRDKGTTFKVKICFCNVPGRVVFLKCDSVEKTHMLKRILTYRACQPRDRIYFYDATEEVFHLQESNLKCESTRFSGMPVANNEQQLLDIEKPALAGFVKRLCGRPDSLKSRPINTSCQRTLYASSLFS
jgi:DNA mismatch repair ATPase MutL